MPFSFNLGVPFGVWNSPCFRGKLGGPKKNPTLRGEGKVILISTLE